MNDLSCLGRRVGERRLRGLALGMLTTLAVFSGFSGEASAQNIPINVTTTPPGVTVYLNSTTGTPFGVTPIQRTRVSGRSHTLIFQLEGYQEQRLPINIRRWNETFEVTMVQLASIVVSAGNPDSEGAQIRVDGQPVGDVPYQGHVQPGRHLVQVGKQGFETFSQWVDLRAGQVFTLAAILQRTAPTTGSILVAGDVSGAPVFLDGQPQGTTPTVIESVTVGQHVVEVRAEGHPPATETVTVLAGQRATVTPTFRQAVQTGSLRVLANIESAMVRVDGESRGRVPVTVEGLTPGEHIVEALADGYGQVRETVTIRSGEQSTISLQLATEGGGRIVVNANIADAIVFIDGQEQGAAPVVVNAPSRGAHAIVVRAEGYDEFRTTCDVSSEDCTINAELTAAETPVRVLANVPEARFYMDGEDQGPVPWEGRLPAGPHLIEVRAPGYVTHREQVQLSSSRETRMFNVNLTGERDTPTQRAEERRERREVVARAAMPVPGDMTVLDASIGWPYLAEVRLGVNVYSFAQDRGGLLTGIGVRTFGRLTEFEGRLQLGYRPIRQVSVGGSFRIGGGVGPGQDPTQAEEMAAMAMGETAGTHPTNTFYTSFEVLTSLHFSRAGAFTVFMGLDIYSDRWDWSEQDRNVLDPRRDRERDRGARLRIGGSIEIVFSQRWNGWILGEGVVAGPSRPVYGDFLGLGIDDLHAAFRLGFTYKFGL